MKIIVMKELRIHRKMLIIWSVIMFLLAAFGGIEFQGLQESMEMLEETVQTFPEIVKITFGIAAFPISSPIGGYASMFYWFQLVVFPFALYIGIHFVNKEEAQSIADFLYTKPYQRRVVILAKAIAAVINNAILDIVCLIGTMIFLVPYIDPEGVLLSMILTSMAGMFFTQLIFTAMGMMLAAVIKSHKRSIATGYVVLIVAYMIAFMTEYSGQMDYLTILTPVRYFSLESLAVNGVSLLYSAVSVILISLFLSAAIWKFDYRDLK